MCGTSDKEDHREMAEKCQRKGRSAKENGRCTSTRKEMERKTTCRNEGIRGSRSNSLRNCIMMDRSRFCNLLDKVSQSTQILASPSTIFSMSCDLMASHVGKMCTDSLNT